MEPKKKKFSKKSFKRINSIILYMDLINGLNICEICNKKYSSYKSLWNHNKKFHNDTVNVKNDTINVKNDTVNVQNNNVNVQNENVNIVQNKEHKCDYCNKIFNSRQGKYQHRLICKQKDIINIQNNNLTNTNDNINNINNTNGTIINGNNNTIINYTINQVGHENIDKLTYDDIKKIFRQHKNSLYYAIDFVNFNENMPENHNFYNSSLEGKYINVFAMKHIHLKRKIKKISLINY
jgi:hypothetical protein